MKSISFIWSDVLHHGHITKQVHSDILGLVTTVVINSVSKDNKRSDVAGLQFTLYGKCEVGDCGPFKVLAIG